MPLTPSENAFNSIYPTVLRIVALHRLIVKCQNEGDVEKAARYFPTLGLEVAQLSQQVDAIEAGQIDECLQTSISGVLNMMRMKAKHN